MSGPLWKGGKWLPTQAITAQVLCQRHNSGLSVLDERIERFATALDRFATELSERNGSAWVFAIHGRDVERWLLKVLCGLMAGGWAFREGSIRLEQEIPKRWLSILYNEEQMPPTWGLYTSGSTRNRLLESGPAAVRVAPILARDKVVGLEAYLFGWTVALMLFPVDREYSGGAIDGDSLRRPALLQTERGEKRIYLHWEPGDRDGPLLDYRYQAILTPI